MMGYEHLDLDAARERLEQAGYVVLEAEQHAKLEQALIRVEELAKAYGDLTHDLQLSEDHADYVGSLLPVRAEPMTKVALEAWGALDNLQQTDLTAEERSQRLAGQETE